MFISRWLIIPLVTGICLLFKTVSRLANEIDKLETALEESNGKSKSLAQRAEVLKQANQCMHEGFIQLNVIHRGCKAVVALNKKVC